MLFSRQTLLAFSSCSLSLARLPYESLVIIKSLGLAKKSTRRGRRGGIDAEMARARKLFLQFGLVNAHSVNNNKTNEIHLFLSSAVCDSEPNFDSLPNLDILAIT